MLLIVMLSPACQSSSVIYGCIFVRFSALQRYINVLKFEEITVFILTSFLKVAEVCATVSGGGLLFSALEVL